MGTCLCGSCITSAVRSIVNMQSCGLSWKGGGTLKSPAPFGRVQVCDFNLSRVMEETAVLSSMAATNPRWLAPEILAGRGYTFSSDIYSFGIILWEFLTWRVPWHEYGPWQVRQAAAAAPALSLTCWYFAYP